MSTTPSAEKSPQVQAVESVLIPALKEAVKHRAADLLLKFNVPPAFRIGDFFQTLARLPNPTRGESLKLIAEWFLLNKKEQRLNNEWTVGQAMDFAIQIRGIGRFRINCYKERGQIAIAIRNIPLEIGSIERLNLPEKMGTVALAKNGLVLVTGVTGSGKSTALAAMIKHINEHKQQNIITLEDPIEYVHNDIKRFISQREIGADTPSFQQGMRHLLRQAPDVMMIGEIRDFETLDIALKAANTGHLVFSTLHTTDARLTIQRVLSFYPPHQHQEVRMLLANSLRAIFSLRLIPRKNSPGRIPAVETLINTEAVRTAIRETDGHTTVGDLIKDGAQYGMASFDQSLAKLVEADAITEDVALQYATSPEDLKLRLQGIS